MAQILVRAFEPTSIRPLDGHQWRQGDILDVKPDTHIWGTLECLPKCWVIKIPGVAVSEVKSYLDQVVDANGFVTRMRGKRLAYNTLSKPLQRQLDDTGTLTVTKAQFDSYVAQL